MFSLPVSTNLDKNDSLLISDNGVASVTSLGVAIRDMLAFANIYPANLYGIVPGMSLFAASLNTLMGFVAEKGGGVINLQSGVYTAERTVDNKYTGVLVEGPYSPCYSDASVTYSGATIQAGFSGVLAKRRSPYGSTNSKTQAGGFKNVSLSGNSQSTTLLEVDSVSGAIIRVYVTGCVGETAVVFKSGVSGVDLNEACDIQECDIHIVASLIDTPEERECGVVDFTGSTNANFSANNNVTIKAQYANGDCVTCTSADTNKIKIHGYRPVGYTGKVLLVKGSTSVHPVGGDNNVFEVSGPSSVGSIHAQGTETSGVTSSVTNIIHLDKINGTASPTAGTGSLWIASESRGVEVNCAIGGLTLGDNSASAFSQRNNRSVRSLFIYNGSQAHIGITNGNAIWEQRMDGDNNLEWIRSSGSTGGLKLPATIKLSALPNSYSSDSAAAAGGVPLGGIYRDGSVLKLRTG